MATPITAVSTDSLMMAGMLRLSIEGSEADSVDMERFFIENEHERHEDAWGCYERLYRSTACPAFFIVYRSAAKRGKTGSTLGLQIPAEQHTGRS